MTGSAKQSRAARGALDCFVASLLAMTVEYEFSFSRRSAPEVCKFVRALEVRGRLRSSKEDACDPQKRTQGMPGGRCHPWVGKRMPGSATGGPASHRHSLRNGFTVSFVLSPATGLCCRRHSRKLSLLTRLTPALVRQDHTTSPYASSAVRPRDTNRVTTPKRPPHPAPTFVTTADAPLTGQDGMTRATDLVLESRPISVNRKRGLGGLLSICRSG